MSQRESGFYRDKGVPDEEVERLRSLDYPTFVTESILRDEDLGHAKLLDIGSGPGSKLAEYVRARGGAYIALDLREEMLAKLKEVLPREIPFHGVQADVSHLPFGDGAVEYVHQRFVLMHLSPRERREALKEIFRVAKRKVFLLEYNWATFQSTKDSELVRELVGLSSELAERMHANLNMGSELAHTLRELDPNPTAQIQRFQRPEGNYTTELVALCRASIQMARIRLEDDILAQKFFSLLSKIGGKIIHFSPPEIVAAVIEKYR